MKKPTPYLYRRQARLAVLRDRQRRRHAERQYVPPQNRFVRPGSTLMAPIKFDAIRSEGLEVLKFLRAMAHTVLKLKIPVILDFRRTTIFFPVTTIYLFAEIDRVVALSELDKPITIIDPRLRRPREVLKQIGIHEITGDNCDIIPEREDVVYWKATKGRDQSGTDLAVLEVVAKRVNRDHAENLQLSGLWRGVSEAVGNSVEHAYKVPREDGFQGLDDTRWWMFTQLRSGTFTVAVCDLGCGYRKTIAETLPQKFVLDLAAAFKGTNADAVAILTAMEYGKTSTRLTERGKGSRDALSVLLKHGRGDLMIVSNTGWVQYTASGNNPLAETRGSLTIDIRGTIIWWKLPIGDLK